MDKVILRKTSSVIGFDIDVLSWDNAVANLNQWALNKESKYVCICNAHSLVTANLDTRFAEVIRHADMCTADGAPVAWMLRRMGNKQQKRINGPDLMWRFCEKGDKSIQIFLYGSTEESLGLLQEKMIESFPELKIVGAYSPPFRNLSLEEDLAIIDKINNSGASLVWVSLGCPKQEIWMAEHKGKIRGVMVGVGAAFDYHSGILRRAPKWMQDNGLEWAYRFFQEPLRLWKRYFLTNSIFIFYAGRQLFRKYLNR